MGDEQQFCLRWNNFQANITTQFEALRDEEDFVDVTLACEGQRIKAHKVVLSACSPYFKELFRSNPCKHPILFMRDVEFRHLQSLIEFMYAGEVNVAQAHLSSFLRTAESLQIRGLTEAPQRHKQDPKDKTQNDTASNALIQQLINNARPQSTSPRATSQNNTSSQEEEEDDDILSGSSTLSPPPSKRAREEDESVPQTHLPLTISQPADTAITTHELEPRYNKGPSPEMFQPKTEAPDYNSDGESKGNFLTLDNSMLDNSFSSMHGGLDMLAGPSTQAFTGDPTQDAALAAHHQKLHSLDPRPCPICNRMYSNLSNLRQHVRLIHNPQTVACPLCSKPFKTKLYLKRHLMSFHELLWTSTTAGAAAAAKTAGTVAGNVAATQATSQFFPTPQGLSNSQPTEDKGNFHGQSPNKCKEASQPTQQEYFQAQRSYQNTPLNGDQTYAPHAGSNNQEMSTFSTTQVQKDGDYQRNQDKSRFKPPESDSYIGGIALENEFQSNYVPNNDGMESFNANNQKTGEFIGPMVHGKSVDGQVSYQSSEGRDSSREGQTAYECSDSSRSHVKQVGHVLE